jgi:hypothetical protein
MEQERENRKSGRYVVDGISGNVLNIADLDILNISIDGIAIETPKRLELNREYTFKIQSQDDILHLKGRVVWAMLFSREAKNSEKIIPVYRVGIHFSETLSEKANLLLNFIEEHKIKALDQRLVGMRFQITGSDDIKLEYPYGYKVKKLSLSGMLIRMDHTLDLNVTYPIELFLQDRHLHIEGKVVNCEKIDSEKDLSYDIGIEFVMMPDEDSDAIRDFLQTLK